MVELSGKEIVIIGGAGFVGSRLCEALCIENRVTCLDNYLSGSVNNHCGNVQYFKGSSQLIGDILGDIDPDLIFHFGEYSRVESSFKDYDTIIENNLKPFSAVLDYAREKSAKLIYSGSSTKFAEYGPADLVSPYAWAKIQNTNHLRLYAEWFNLEYAIVYFYNVYGGNEVKSGPFSTVIAKYKELLSRGEELLPVVLPGTQKRNFTHFSDIVDGLITVAVRGNGDGFGIGADRELSILDIVKILGCEPKFIPSRMGNRMGATLVTAATKELGWRAKIDIEEHLREFKSELNKR